MSESKQALANLLFAFADVLNSMNDREFDLLLQGKVKLRVVNERKTMERADVDTNLQHVAMDLADKLSVAESREVAESLIASINQPRKRDFLVMLAQSCGVSVGSKDTIAKIEQKLVEGTVGLKLRSRAIQKVAF